MFEWIIIISVLIYFIIHLLRILLPLAQFVLSEKGSYQDISIVKFKKQGEHCRMTCSYKILVIKFLSRKYVALLSTSFDCALVDTDKTFLKTIE